MRSIYYDRYFIGSDAVFDRLPNSLKAHVVLLQPILGLTQEFCWVRACIGSG